MLPILISGTEHFFTDFIKSDKSSCINEFLFISWSGSDAIPRPDSFGPSFLPYKSVGIFCGNKME